MDEDYIRFRSIAARVLDVILYVMIATPLLCFLPIYIGVISFVIAKGHWPISHYEPIPWQGWTYNLQVSLLGVIVWASLLGTPVALPFWRFLNPTARFATRVLLFVLGLLLATLILVNDPGDYIDWYWD